MPTTEFDIDTFLDDMASNVDVSLQSESGGTDTNEPWFESGYEGTIDYRIRQLSYSSSTLLHTCPRKFELYKKRSTHRTEELAKSTITFAFGHVVGAAIQDVLRGLSEKEIIWKMFLGWHAPLFAIDEKAAKSFWFAVIGIKKFIALRKGGFLDEYELVDYQGKPAVELSFAVTFPDGFRLRGFVDAVLKNKHTGEVIVLECKTTKQKQVDPAEFKNSAQAIGYSIILDVIFPKISSYKVLYLIYQTTIGEFTTMPFMKTYLQRALWLRELLLDIEMIKLYAAAEVFPMHGENCYDFFRACEYINTCTLSTEFLTKKCTPAEEDKFDYQVKLTFQDLLETQIAKASE